METGLTPEQGATTMWDIVRDAIVQAWRQFEQQSLAVLPNVLASLLFLIVGLPIAWILGRIARVLLSRSRVDREANRLGLTIWIERLGIVSAAAGLARLVQVLLVLLTVLLALYSLDAKLASELVKGFFLYLPNVAVAVFVLAGGVLVGRFADRSVRIGAVNLGVPSARLLGQFVKLAVVVLASAVGLEHLGIGHGVVTAAFLILLGGMTLAAALAVGLGSRDFVQRWLEHKTPPSDGDRSPIEHV
jgi:hypothetical protein